MKSLLGFFDLKKKKKQTVISKLSFCTKWNGVQRRSPGASMTITGDQVGSLLWMMLGMSPLITTPLSRRVRPMGTRENTNPMTKSDCMTFPRDSLLQQTSAENKCKQEARGEKLEAFERRILGKYGNCLALHCLTALPGGTCLDLISAEMLLFSKTMLISQVVTRMLNTKVMKNTPNNICMAWLLLLLCFWFL